MVKNLPANAGEARDLGLIPGLERSTGIGNDNPFQYSCWKIPWKEGPGRLQSMRSQRVRHDWVCTCLVVQQLRLCASKKGMWVWSLVRELRFHMPGSAVKTNKPQLIKKETEINIWYWVPLTIFCDYSVLENLHVIRQIHLLQMMRLAVSTYNRGKQKCHQLHFISDLSFRCCLSHLHRRVLLGTAFSKFHSDCFLQSLQETLKYCGHSVLL